MQEMTMFWTLIGLGVSILSLLIGLHISQVKNDRAFRTEVSSRFQGVEKWVREDLKDVGGEIKDTREEIREDLKEMRKEMSDDRKAVQERLIALEHPVST